MMRGVKQWLDPRLAVDGTVTLISFYGSYALTYGRTGFDDNVSGLTKFVAFAVAIRLATFTVAGLYKVVWRHTSAGDVISLAQAVGVSAGLLTLAQVLFQTAPVGPRFFVIETLVTTLSLLGVRIFRRQVHQQRSRSFVRKNGRKTLIYGAGMNGRLLAQRFMTDTQLGLFPVGFVDDSLELVGTQVGSLPVLGTAEDLERLIKAYSVQELLITTSHLPGESLQKALQVAHALRIRPRMLSDFGLKSQESQKFELFRDIELDDLLNRPKVQVDLSGIARVVEGRSVLITGAGGSIGSELARQVLALKPQKLLLLDHSEFNLYKVDQELRNGSAANVCVPVMMDIKDESALRKLMSEHKPQAVFHAAAYKHVHLVEANPYTSILNNVLGTHTLVEAALTAGTDYFVLISSDKAVNPVGLMGATKRICELLVTEAAMRSEKRFCSVRFGNVLGSSGSFIPLLKQQIRNGGPVTITHQDMTRYFMLIREAVALVLKASSISKPGDINILRMGNPIRIVDIARNLITLLGRTEQDVPIIFTGMRPGEKMYEELYLCGDELETEHPDIVVLPKGDLAINKDGSISELVSRMVGFARDSRPEAVTLLRDLVSSHSRKKSETEDKRAA